MNSTDLTKILQNPTLVNKEHAYDLEQLIEEFPYFQASRALLLKHYKDQESFKYNQALKTTAAYTTDRSILFDFITSLSQGEPIKDKLPSMPFDEAIKMNLAEAESVLNPKLFYTKEDTTVLDIPITNEQESNLTVVTEEITEEPIDETLNKETSKEIIDSSVQVSSTSSDVENITIPENKSLEHITHTEEEDLKEDNFIDLSEIAVVAEEIVADTKDFKHTTIQESLIEKEEEIKELEEQLEINKPLSFNKGEVHSFKEWLKLTTLSPVEREENESTEKPEAIENPLQQSIQESFTIAKEISSQANEAKEDREEKTPTEKASKEDALSSSQKNTFDIIDQFIATNPKIPPVAKRGAPSKNLASDNLIPTDSLMTETLAKVYLAQHNYKKAIQAYKILILKNPEKSGFFADQIRAIKKLQENK